MNLKECSPRALHDRTERAQAKLARIARVDCWHGGAKALVLANRLERMGSQIDPQAVVSAAYTNTRGNARQYLAYECPECGSPVQGADNAYQHCTEQQMEGEE